MLPNSTLLKPPRGEQRNLLFTAVLTVSIIMVFGVLIGSGQESVDNEVSYPIVQVEEENVIEAPQNLLFETPIMEPPYVPVMKPYEISKVGDIWHAQEPRSYITPENDWVRYYASRLYIDYDGRLRYKEKPIPLLSDTKGNVILWTDEPFMNNYIYDNDQFNYPPNGDVWVTPDYYLTHGMKDDCDGWMVTVTSLMLSGEISVRDNEQFVKKVIPVKAVLGYMDGFRDGWVEYQVYGTTFVSTTALAQYGIKNEKIPITEFVDMKNKTGVKPVFEFTDNRFEKYYSW